MWYIISRKLIPLLHSQHHIVQFCNQTSHLVNLIWHSEKENICFLKLNPYERMCIVTSPKDVWYAVIGNNYLLLNGQLVLNVCNLTKSSTEPDILITMPLISLRALGTLKMESMISNCEDIMKLNIPMELKLDINYIKNLARSKACIQNDTFDNLSNYYVDRGRPFVVCLNPYYATGFTLSDFMDYAPPS